MTEDGVFEFGSGDNVSEKHKNVKFKYHQLTSSQQMAGGEDSHSALSSSFNKDSSNKASTTKI